MHIQYSRQGFQKTTIAGVLGAGAVLLLTAGAALAADTRIEEERALAPGGSFELRTDVGSVDIRGTATSGARLSIETDRSDFAELYSIRIDESAGKVAVRIERKDKGVWGWFGTSFRGHVRISVDVPAETAIEASTSGGAVTVSGIQRSTDVETSGGSISASDIGADLKADTSGGSITAERIAGDTRLETSGGGIEARDIGGTLYADTSGGGIDIAGVRGDIKASTSGGGVDIEGAGGRVEAQSSGGPVSVSFAPGNSRGGEISSSGGSVAAKIDPSISLDVDAETSGGGVHCDLPVTVRGELSRGELHGTLNGGGALLRLRASGGGIRIREI